MLVFYQENNEGMLKNFALVCVFLIAIAWLVTRPASYHEVGESRNLGEMPLALIEADIGDIISRYLVTIGKEVPAHDEVLQVTGTDKVLVSARDELIWEVDINTGKASRLAYSPVSPTGAKMVPGSDRLAYYCMARLYYNEYQHDPGLYLLNLETGSDYPCQD